MPPYRTIPSNEEPERFGRLSGLGKTVRDSCALIMYLLGERSSPLHCGQNPLLSGRQEPAPSARSGLLITLIPNF